MGVIYRESGINTHAINPKKYFNTLRNLFPIVIKQLFLAIEKSFSTC